MGISSTISYQCDECGLASTAIDETWLRLEINAVLNGLRSMNKLIYCPSCLRGGLATILSSSAAKIRLS